MENHKDKNKVYENRFWVRELISVWKVLAPYNSRPKTVPLMKHTNGWVFLMFIFPKSNKKRNIQKKHFFICFLVPKKINHCSYVSPFLMEN